MANVNLVLSPEAVVRVHDAITCLSKFSENIGWEASSNKLVLSALNISKTASASITFDAPGFFQSYKFYLVDGSRQRSQPEGAAFRCHILSKALLSVFKGRLVDARDRETAIESCEISVREGIDHAENRLVVKMICRHGVKKTYKLTYEPGDTVRAVFNHDAVKNRWTISAHIPRAFSEYFGARTEHLDFYYESGRFLVTSYTEKIKNGAEVLRQPLQTSITLDRLEFDQFSVEEKMHVGISVKDFKAIIAHAESLRTTINALYSYPKQPLQLNYREHGMECAFTLVTIGEYRGGSVAPAPAPIIGQAPDRASARPETQRQSANNPARSTATNSMPPPVQPASRSFTRDLASHVPPRPSPPPPQASINHDSLFVTEDDDEEERRWGEHDYDEDQDDLRWDSGEGISRGSLSQSLRSKPQIVNDPGFEEDAGVPPTQRMSQVRGLFDD